MKISTILTGMLLMVFLASEFVSARVVLVSGTDAEFWKNHAVVICRVEKAVSTKTSDKAKVSVLVVVATDLPVPSVFTIEEIPLVESAIHANLFDGEIAILCIERKHDAWALPGDIVAFFPSHCAVQPIKAIDESIVEQVVTRVQAAREVSRRK